VPKSEILAKQNEEFSKSDDDDDDDRGSSGDAWLRNRDADRQRVEEGEGEEEVEEEKPFSTSMDFTPLRSRFCRNGTIIAYPTQNTLRETRGT